MERREFFEKSGFALLAAAGSVASPLPAAGPVRNVADFGAVGDGVADDTAALQKAIDGALAAGQPCVLPAGVFRITDTLVVGDPSSKQNYEGFKLGGQGKAAKGSGKGGTTLFFDGDNAEAIIRFEKNVWRYCELRDMGLQCRAAGTASYGVLFNGTQFSNHLVDNIGLWGPDIAFGIREGSGVNGEFIMFNNCGAWYVETFYRTNAGQAYVQYFHHCECLLRGSGTYFYLDLKTGGGGINVVDFNGRGQGTDGNPSNTTLIKNKNSDSCLNIFGGRIEGLTQLYDAIGHTSDLHVTANISGLQVTCDCNPDSPTLTKPGFINISHSPDILVIDSCTFQGNSEKEAFTVHLYASAAYVLFRGCYFNGFRQPPNFNTQFADRASQVAFEDCKATVPIPPAPIHAGNRPIPFERLSQQGIDAIGRRKAYSENGWVHSGRPINLLSAANFTMATGAHIVADPPWQHFGSTPAIDVFDSSHPHEPDQSSSPAAKLIVLKPSSGLYQDIATVDLCRTQPSYSFDGYDFYLVNYQAMLARFSGNASVRFSLMDAVDNTVYDETTLTNEGSTRGVRLVTLSANVKRKDAPSAVRLKIENLAGADAAVEFLWQLAANDANPAFVSTDAAPVAYATEWGVNSESARFWHRFALPHKFDRFGSTAMPRLDDLVSDLYLSRTSERLTYFANAQWWTAPRATTAAAVPSDRRWARGDLIINAEPTAGGHLGWVQITPGDVPAELNWTPGAAFKPSARVFCQNRVYECIQGGTSATSEGPSAEGDKVADGTCVWRFMGALAPLACDIKWLPAQYGLGDRVYYEGNVYECAKAGTSSAPQLPKPNKTGDGTPDWKWLGLHAEFKTFGPIGR